MGEFSYVHGVSATPLIGATGYGLAVSIKEAQNFCDFDLDGARVVVQGFGSVGQHGARFLTQAGAVLVGAADSRGCVVDPKGLDVEKLIQHKLESGTVCGFENVQTLDADSIIGIECDIWIPAARPDVIHMNNVERLNTRLIAEGANIPMTHDAEQFLMRRGVTVIPDFIANAGGVICASVEFHSGTKAAAFESIEDKIGENTTAMFELVRSANVTPRAAAIELAHQRLREAMTYRRWGSRVDP